MTAEGVDDSLASALRGLRRALQQNEEHARVLLGASSSLARRRDEGSSWVDLIQSEDGSRTIALLTDATSSLMDANANFRRVLAKTLYEDGVTMARVAEVLGVTRQRVARILADD